MTDKEVIEELREKIAGYRQVICSLSSYNNQLLDKLHAQERPTKATGTGQSWLLDSTEEGKRELVRGEQGFTLRPYEAPRIYQDSE